MNKNIRKKPFRRFFSMRAVAPNAVTLMAFAAGLTSIRFALAGKWELSVASIVLAGVLDGLDGAVARLLKSTSRFGAELDSLSDVVVFGVAPAIILYLWTLQSLDRLGWAFALVYAMAMALRLARFNARLEDDEDPKRKLGYLTGVPAPMGAGLVALPLAIEFAFEVAIFRPYPHLVGLYTVVVAIMMVATFPSPSLKTLRIPRDSFVPLMLMVGIFIASLFVYTWYILSLIPIVYMLSLPFCYIGFRKGIKKLEKIE